MSRKLTLRAKDPQTLVLSGMDDFLSSLLRDIPKLGTPSFETEHRLFPDPTGGQEVEADEDWQEYVRPELEEHFAQNRDLVQEDLRGMRKSSEEGFELEIPMANLPHWIHALNQARLVLHTYHKLEEQELEEGVQVPGKKGLALFQIQFFGLLQEWMLSLVDTF